MSSSRLNTSEVLEGSRPYVVAAEKPNAPPESTPLKDALPQEFVGDPRRFLVLALFSLFSISNALQWISFAPVAEESKAYFRMNTMQLNSLSFVYMVVYFMGAFATCHTLQRVGLTVTLRWGAALTAVGAIIKLLASWLWPCYAVVFSGQTVLSIGQLFLLSIPPQLAANWFLSQERTLATSIAVNANNVGIAAGMLVPPLLVHPGSAGRTAFSVLYGVEAALAVLALLLILSFVPTAPHTPPSAAALRAHMSGLTEPPVNPLVQTLVVLRNSNYRRLLLAVGTNIGLSWALSSIMAQIALPFGVSERTSGTCSFAAILIGTAAAAVIGAWVDRTQCYKPPLLLLITVSTVSTVGTLLALKLTDPGSLLQNVLYCGSFACAQIAQFAVMPIAFEFGAELSFPVIESYSSTLTAGLANFVAFIAVIVSSVVLGNKTPASDRRALYVLGGFISVIAFTLIVGATVHTNLKRSTFEAAEEKDQSSSGADSPRATANYEPVS